MENILTPGQAGDGVILYGPRGNGKTTLLDELERLALKKGAIVRHLSRPVMGKGVREVCRALLSDGNGPKEFWWWFWAKLMQVSNPLRLGFEPHASIERVLRTMMKKAPMLVLVDEAHTMPTEAGNPLLLAMQKCFREELPLLLVLAGTPSIMDVLNKTEASFVERSVVLPIGRLETKEAARDALAIPVERAALQFDDDALELLVAESQLYPYFIQMLGQAVWDVAEEAGHQRISLQDAKEGIKRSVDARMGFYTRRMNELGKQGILAEAQAVSRAMRGRGENPRLPYMELSRVLKDVTSTTGNSPDKVETKLVHEGLIWLMPTTYWEPGIPSFCDFLANMPEERAGTTAEG